MRRAAQRVAEGYSVRRAAPTRPGSSGRPPRPTPAGASPPSTSATPRSASAASTCARRPPGSDGAPIDPGAAGPFYIGRISVTDDDHTPLVVDWRAPVAEPFYRATAVEPMGVARRRHFQTHGRRLVGLDDEVFDADAADDVGLHGGGRGRAARRARPRAHRPHGRHRRHHPGRAGRGDPRADSPASSSSPAAPAPARPRSRCTAPRTSSTRTAGGSASQGVLLVGPEPDVPALHRPGAPVARRGRGRSWPPPPSLEAAAARARPPSRRPSPRSRATRRMAQGDRRRDRRPRAADAARRRRRARRLRAAAAPARLAPHRRAHARRRGTHNERRPYVAGLVLDHFRREYRRALVRRTAPTAPGSTPTRSSSSRRPLGGEVVDPPSPPTLARGEAAPPEWEDELTDRAAPRCPRCAPRSSACGRCSAAPSWSTTCSGSRRSSAPRPTACSPTTSSGCCSASAVADVARRRVDRGRPRAASTKPTRCSARRARRARVAVAATGATSAIEMARRTVDELGVGGFTERAEQVLDRYGSDTPRRRRRRRRAAHVRARARRRGAGPHRDAVADARPPLPVGLDDARRRLRPGEPARRRSPSWDDVLAQPARAGAAAPGDAHGQLPHAGRDHGRRQPPAARRGARRRARPSGAQHRRAPRGRHGRRRRAGRVGRRVGPRCVDALRRRHGRGDRAASSCTPRSSTRSPTSARSPTTSRRSTRRSRCSPASTPRASSSTT